MAKANARKYQVISTDGHIEVSPSNWFKYVPDAYKGWAPREISLPEGGEAWMIEGSDLVYNGQNASGGIEQPGAGVQMKNVSYYLPGGGFRPGCGPAKQRLQEQDIDGIDAEVLYPPVSAQGALSKIVDKRAYVAQIQAYNTFLSQDYCSVAPDRLLGNAIIPTSGVEDAIKEMKRVKGLGIDTITLSQYPNGSGRSKPEDDKFWEAALKADMRLSPHLGFGLRTPEFGAGIYADFPSLLSQRCPSPAYNVAQLICSGVFERMPELRFYFAEANTGWLPTTFFTMDDNVKVFGPWFGIKKMKKLPSEYIADHFYFSFIRDPLSMKQQSLYPKGFAENNLMWGTDCPHSVGSFPKSQKWLDIIFDGVSDSLKRRILLENPAKFWDLDLEKAITTTPK